MAPNQLNSEVVPDDSDLLGSSGPKHNQQQHNQQQQKKQYQEGGNSVWWVNGAFVVVIHALALLVPFYQVKTSAVYAVFIALLSLSNMGITAGYHRLWSHRTYSASAPLRLLLMIGGTLGFQGSIRWWVLRHRIHHRFTDTEDDPYTIKKGFFFAHMGWIFEKPHYKKMSLIDASDLDADWVVVFQHRNYVALALTLGFGLPTALGFAIGDPIGTFLYSGILARIACWHFTFSINSLAHWIGDREFDPKITAAGGLLVSFLTNGEGYHNFHHAYPKDYRNGIRWYDFDPTKWFIRSCAFLGLASNLIQNSNEDIEKSKIFALEELIKAKKTQYNWGTKEEDLPLMTVEEYQRLVREGRDLVQIDGFIHDVQDFKEVHPGGDKILKAYYGKDATQAFHGGLNFHTVAASNHSRMLRVAKLENTKKEQ